MEQIIFAFDRQSVAMVTTNLPKPYRLNNFYIIQSIKVKFRIYDDFEVYVMQDSNVSLKGKWVAMATTNFFV